MPRLVMPRQRLDGTRYVALLRAINVGGHNVKMADVREQFALLGFSNVETFIASGNVRFSSGTEDSAALEAQIETRLAAHLGYAVDTFIRTSAEVMTAAARRVFGGAEPVAGASALTVGFLKFPLSIEAQQRVLALAGTTNEFEFHNRDFYWWTASRMSDSTITGARLEKALGMSTTMRNITTVRKLALLCSENA